MHRIHPISTDSIRPHIGQQVCIVTRDGRHLYGSLDSIRGGKLYLRGGQEGPQLSSFQKRPKSTFHSNKGKRPAKTAKTSSSPFGFGAPFGVPGFGLGTGLGIDIALIATLFLLPFLFI
ncbi:hypothetical protein ACFOQM_06595 [Paenibacillus sp. GCM10012307]|uniref:Uncharacterized protein n=1 Tax=Paenibacillus roseus TaxID=2798579 RepID=A0A934MPK4_9BACL|nr:hypothetical protein [Paenibacillus roseus]MBJ6360968.1 hypothetical protein [Paenibacillus roseus]